MAANGWLLVLAKEAFGALPGTNVLTKALERLIERRRITARQILFDAPSEGEISLPQAINEEEAAAIFYRFYRAAVEGTATLNLKLMAKVIAGQAFVGNLVADEFLYYADILASLRREEIILIATMHTIHKRAPDRMTSTEKTDELVRSLVPRLFASAEMVRATAMACTRTGLVMDYNTMDDMGHYTTSPLMDRLEKLAPFEETLRGEGVDVSEP